MNINKYIKGVAIALSAITLSSCASDYLDTPTYGSIPAEDICKTAESARMSVLTLMGRGMSSPWSSTAMRPAQALMQGETGFSYYIGEMPGPDNYVNFIYNEAPSWVLIYNQMDGYLSSGQYVWSNTWWLYSYAMIAQANEIIEGCNAIGTYPEDQAALYNFTKAQALALRAHCYWRLLQVYAPRWADSNNGQKLSVVLRTSSKDPQHKAVSPMIDVLNQCYKDLDESLACFDAAGKSFRSLNFEVDKNVAYGIYARVAALRDDWATVKTMAHNARQGKRIATSAEIFNGYTSYNANEWMWAPSFDQIDNFIYGNFCTFFACNGYAALNARYTNSINRDLYKLIPEDDERTNWWYTYEKTPQQAAEFFYDIDRVNPETGQLKNNRMLKAARAWLDERKPSVITGDDAYANANIADETTSIVRDGAQIKFWCNGVTGQETMCQVPFMRATEMYLYEAEACAMLGETGEAQALLLEINKPRNPNYTCSLSGQALIDEVRLYRRIELWGEGFCWFDFKRWNIPMHRTAWEKGVVGSGNIPAALACDVPVTQNLGWRFGIPLSEQRYNDYITEPVPGEVLSNSGE